MLLCNSFKTRLKKVNIKFWKCVNLLFPADIILYSWIVIKSNCFNFFIIWVYHFKINQLKSIFEFKFVERIWLEIVKICNKCFNWSNCKLKHIFWLVFLVMITFCSCAFIWSCWVFFQSNHFILYFQFEFIFKMIYNLFLKSRWETCTFDSHDNSKSNIQMASLGIKIFSLFNYKTSRKW